MNSIHIHVIQLDGVNRIYKTVFQTFKIVFDLDGEGQATFNWDGEADFIVILMIYIESFTGLQKILFNLQKCQNYSSWWKEELPVTTRENH